ncbi:MAG: AmmeMemoRadiSam system protein B [Planctomycetes bacterium]|nr:AmmeMemoRadiSam system protein B [Planctomycetota bacterium]
MNIRSAVRAGSFYEGGQQACRQAAQKLLDSAEVPPGLPDRLPGGIVPHAGWMFSGSQAAMTFKALAASSGGLATVVLFGADHTGAVSSGEVYDKGAWETPLGLAQIDEDVAAAIVKSGDYTGAGLLRSNPRAHAYEHSIEVQVPIIQVLSPAARIVPIGVPCTEHAAAIGRAVGRLLVERFPKAKVVGSTDLTHIGGHFGPAPGGGPAEEFAARNDRRMIDLIEKMDADAVVAEALRNMNACGAGAVAATMAACMEMGATRAHVLQYTNSFRVIKKLFPSDRDDTTVGYLSAVFS